MSSLAQPSPDASFPNANRIPGLNNAPAKPHRRIGWIQNTGRALVFALVATGLGSLIRHEMTSPESTARRANSDHLKQVWEKAKKEKNKEVLWRTLGTIQSLGRDLTPQELSMLGIAPEELERLYAEAQAALMSRAIVASTDPAWCTFITTYLDASEEARDRAKMPADPDWDKQRRDLTLKAISTFADSPDVLPERDPLKIRPHPVATFPEDAYDESLNNLRTRMRDLESQPTVTEDDLLRLWNALGPVPDRINVVNGQSPVPALSGVGITPGRMREVLTKVKGNPSLASQE